MRFLQCMMMFILTACGSEQAISPQDASRSDGFAQDDSAGGIHVTVMTETLYRIDSVLVVVENGNGPDEGTMLEAINIYRKAAIKLLEIDALTEYRYWNALKEIRWDDELVAPIGGTYDYAGNLLLEYHGCIIDPPLYQLLATH